MYNIKRNQKEIQGHNYFTAICTRPAPKARFRKEKIVFAYRFKTEEEREKYIANFLAKEQTKAIEKANAKQKFLEAKKELVNPYKVGDILYDSWGYDQTNIDFYQVIKAGPKSIQIRSIKQINRGECGFMSEYVAPDKDHFCSEPKTKVLQMLKSGEVYIASRHGWISKWNREKITQSHYA